MATYNLGQAAIVMKGVYAAGTAYLPLNCVTNGGGSWICKEACTGIEPGVANGWEEYWQPAASGVKEITITAASAGTATMVITFADNTTASFTYNTSDVADGSITNPKLALRSVGTNNLMLNSVTGPIIENGAVTVEKLSSDVRNYIGAVNFLDNSNFTQFVAQAGISGNHGTQAYAGDRWILDSGTVTGTANENGDGYYGITLNGTIRQTVANPPNVGTPVVEMVSGTATANYADGEVVISSSGGVIKNAALYEGEYAEGGEPRYRPKGYSVELAECQRYYLPFSGGLRWRAVQVNSNIMDFSIPLPCSMRIKPSALGVFNVNTMPGISQTGFTFSIPVSGASCLLFRATKSGHGLTDGFLMSETGALSADL